MRNVIQIKPKYQPTLEEKVESFRTIDREFKRLDKIHKAAKKEVIDLMGDKTEVHNSQGVLIATYYSNSKTHFDTTLFKEEQKDMYERYTLQAVEKRFLLK